MKYSDQQRIGKIRETTEKLLDYVQRERVTPDQILENETVQWTVRHRCTTLGSRSITCPPL